MTMRPEQIQLARQWVAKTEEDFLNAQYTLTLGERCPTSTVCFHAQQCAEKYLKALLTWRGMEFPKTHDLVLLFNRLGPGCGLDLRVEDLQPLNRYSVETRYPGDWDSINLQEASRAVEKVRHIREAVRRVLPAEA
jgi:HEPN domain-containing protein